MILVEAVVKNDHLPVLYGHSGLDKERMSHNAVDSI